MMADYYIAWWNVENLFDTFDSPRRAEWLQKELARELRGWDADVLGRKISQLAAIIGKLNNGEGPDILGLCEIENEAVLEMLVDRLSRLPHDYAIAHADTKDGRGIDVAFVYDRAKFVVQRFFSHFVLKRTATRDLFQVNMATIGGENELILIGNHWPSRRGGEHESEPYRIMVAETLAYWHERIVEIKGKNIPVLVAGDFNDEPFSRSIVDYALSWKSLEKVRRAVLPKFYNLMWEVFGKREGTFYYNGFPHVFDQFMVSRGLMQEDSRIKIKEASAKVLRSSQMVSPGYPAPIPFKRPSHSDYNPNGYSDHYPIGVVVEEG
jgi:predicted extracellular nuclease